MHLFSARSDASDIEMGALSRTLGTMLPAGASASTLPPGGQARQHPFPIQGTPQGAPSAEAVAGHPQASAPPADRITLLTRLMGAIGGPSTAQAAAAAITKDPSRVDGYALVDALAPASGAMLISRRALAEVQHAGRPYGPIR